VQWVNTLSNVLNIIWKCLEIHSYTRRKRNDKIKKMSTLKEINIKKEYNTSDTKCTCPWAQVQLKAAGYVQNANGEWEKPPLLSQKEVKGIVGRQNAQNKTKGIKANEKQIYKAISRRTRQTEATVETLYGEYVTQAVKNINEPKKISSQKTTKKPTQKPIQEPKIIKAP